MLRRLDARMSALLGACWFEESFDVDAKYKELCVIPNERAPGFAVVCTVCQTFFANDPDWISVNGEENKIEVKKIPQSYNARLCNIKPYKLEDVGAGYQHEERAGIYYLTHANKRENKPVRTTGELVLLLCQDFMPDSDDKTALIDKLTRLYTDNAADEQARETERRVQRQIYKEQRKTDLIRVLLTENPSFQQWLVDFQSTKTTFRDVDSRRDVILSAIKERLPW
jgi:hypothetical protein